MVAQLGKLLKGAGKIAKHVYKCDSFIARGGQSLTKGQKVANSCFKILEKSSEVVIIGSVAGAFMSLVPIIYAGTTNNDKLLEQGFFGCSKGIDTFFGAVLGLFAGGPIGALIGAGLAYKTDYSITGSIPAVSENITINDCRDEFARVRQSIYNDVLNLLGFNKSEEVTSVAEIDAEQQGADDKIKFINKDTNEEIEYEFGWIHPDKNMTLTNSKGEIFNLEKGIVYYVEEDGTIKECIDSYSLTPDGNWFGGSVCINEAYTQESDETIKTANGGIYETKKGDIVTYLKDGSLKVEKPFTVDGQATYLEVGKTYTADKDFKLLGANIQSGDKYFVKMDGGIVIMNSETEPNNQFAEFTVSGSDDQFIQKTGQYFCADKDMKLTDRFGIKYEIDESDTYICDESGKIVIKYTGAWTNDVKENMVLNGSFGQVTVKAGNSFCPYNDRLEVVLAKDEIVIDRNGKEHKANASDYVTYNKDGSISIGKVMTTSNDGVYVLTVGKTYETDTATVITDQNNTNHTINVGDKYICDENGVITVIPKGSQISFRRLGKGAQPLELAVGQSHVAEENMKFLVGRNNNLVSVNQNDTLVCKPDSTLEVRQFEPQAQKVSIRKIGTPAPVEYEVGKEYTASGVTRFLSGANNQLVTIQDGQKFVVKADGTVNIVNGN